MFCQNCNGISFIVNLALWGVMSEMLLLDIYDAIFLVCISAFSLEIL